MKSYRISSLNILGCKLRKLPVCSEKYFSINIDINYISNEILNINIQ